MGLVCVLILNPQYTHSCTSGCVFIDSIRYETNSSGWIIYVNHLQWNNFKSLLLAIFFCLQLISSVSDEFYYITKEAEEDQQH